jgi:probable F420-dependent oxidoreductase
VTPFRFGLQGSAADPAAAARLARQAEDAGFDIFQVGDHIGAEPSALLTLAAAASRTSRIRLGTLTLNADLHHPVPLAQELATLDHLSGGRLEAGLGAGHSFDEYAAMGKLFDPAPVRKARLAESVEILRPLLAGEPVTYHGNHFTLEDATTLASRQPHLPLLVGVNGRTALAHATRHADVVSLTMLGRTREDGHHHDVRWEAARLDRTVAAIRDEADRHGRSPELHALVQAVVVTTDRGAAVRELALRTGTEETDMAVTPFVCLGTHDEMAEHLVACRERWGISYFSVRDVERFAPVIALVRDT